MKNQNLDQNQHTPESTTEDTKSNINNSSQNGTSKSKETVDKITETEDENISNQEILKEREEPVITERVNNSPSIFATICGSSQKHTSEENTLAQNLSKYFGSEELKNILKNNGLDNNNSTAFINKLKEYLERYKSSKIDLDNLKEKFVNYFKQFKSCNKDTIDKNQAIGENIDAIMKTISYYIKKEEDITTEAFETQTFGGDYNTNKSCLEIPLLDISAINEDKVGSSDSTYAWAIECDNNPKNFDKSQFYNKYPGLKPYECHNISKEELYTKYSKLKSYLCKISKQKSNSAQENVSEKNVDVWDSPNKDSQKFKIKLFIEIYEKTFGYKIFPATEELIVDLVLETEQYIEKVKQIVCDYKISNRGIKDKIMKEVCDSTSKEMVESHLNKSTIGKKILKLIQGQKQEEELKNSYLTKLLSKANKIYEKAYNKYKGYDNLSEKEIAKIAEYAYQRLLETDEDKSKRDLYNESTSKKLCSGAEDMKVIEEFVKSKGYTVEDYPSIDFHEINQSIGVQTQQEEEPETMINVSYHYNINPLMAFAAAALLGAMHYMTQYDSEVLHHGFGPSGL